MNVTCWEGEAELGPESTESACAAGAAMARPVPTSAKAEIAVATLRHVWVNDMCSPITRVLGSSASNFSVTNNDNPKSCFSAYLDVRSNAGG